MSPTVVHWPLLALSLLTAVTQGDQHRHQDTRDHFEITVPAGWKVTDAPSDSSFLRCSAVSPDADLSIAVYSSRVERGRVNLDKVVGSAHQLFKNLGPEMERRQIQGRYEISFGRNPRGYYSKAIFAAKEQHYYVVLALSRVNDYSSATTILDSFTITAQYRFLTVVFLVGSLSLALHLFLLHRQFLAEYLRTVVRSLLRWRVWNADFGIAALYLGGLVAVDYFVTQKLFGAFLVDGMSGLTTELFRLGPYLFDLAGELIAEFMAGALGFGIWPGGSTGVVLTTAVSVIVNVFEVHYLVGVYAEKLKTLQEASD